jgi:hypothetical protein
MEVCRGKDQPAGQYPVGKYFLRTVYIGQESLEGAYALGYAPLDNRPFVSRDDPGDQVERERPLLARQGEGDPLVPKASVTGQAASPVVLGRQRPQHVMQGHIVRTGTKRAVCTATFEHLVPSHAPGQGEFPSAPVIGTEQVAHQVLATTPLFRPCYRPVVMAGRW